MALTDPIFVNSDPATILTAILADFEALGGVPIMPAQPEYIIASAIAYRESLAMNRINAAGKAMLVDFSTAPVLDYLAALFNIVRLPAQGAVCTLQFTIVTGHLQVVIPLGTRVSSSDSKAVFTTNDDVLVAIGINVVTITATCQTTGNSGNNYAIGNVNTLLDPYAYISSVQNLDITSGGADDETDDELRSRVKLDTSKFSTAGSTNAYIYWAKTANPLISDVQISTLGDYLPIGSISAYDNTHTYGVNDFVTESGIVAVCIKAATVGIHPITDQINWIKAGEVHVFALLNNGEIPTTAINNSISQLLPAENIRPLTDVVVVQDPTEIIYTLEVDIVKYTDADGPTLISSISSILNAFAVEKKQKLGLDIVATYIESIGRITGVYDLTATITIVSGSTLVGRNISVSPWQVAKLQTSGLTINITGSSNG